MSFIETPSIDECASPRPAEGNKVAPVRSTVRLRKQRGHPACAGGCHPTVTGANTGAHPTSRPYDPSLGETGAGAPAGLQNQHGAQPFATAARVPDVTVEGTLREHHRGHARPRAVTRFRRIASSCWFFVPATTRLCPRFPFQTSMVRNAMKKGLPGGTLRFVTGSYRRGGPL